MAAVIRLKRSEVASTSPTSSDLSVGEVAINTADKKIFVKDSNNNIITLGITNIVDDTTPQLGGDLDVNGNDIVSTSNGNINLSPNGTGSVVINTDLDVDNLNLNGNQISATDADGDIWIQQNGVGSIYLDDVEIQNASIQSRFDNGSFNINSKGTGSLFLDDLKIKDATIESYGTDQDITISPDGTGTVIIDTDLDVDNLNLNGNTISSVNTDGNIIITPNGSGVVNASNLTINSAIVFPTSDGSAGQVLQTDGEGNITFADQSSSSSGENISYSVTQSSHGFSVSDVLYFDGTIYAKAQADDSTTLGLFLVSSVTDTNNFTVTLSGKVTGLSSLTAGQYYFLSESTSGLLTTSEPSSGYSNPILFSLSATEGIVLPYRPQELTSGGIEGARTTLDVYSKSETSAISSAFAIALG